KNLGLRIKRLRLKVRGLRFVIFFVAGLVLLLSDIANAGKPIGKRIVLDNGMVLLISERHHLPIVSVNMIIKAGSILEPEEKAGLASLTSELLTEGTEKRTATQISEEIEFVGGSVDTGATYDYASATLSILKKDIELGFDILSDILLNPSFRDEEIQRKKDLIKGALKKRKEEPDWIASKEFDRVVFGRHPYGRDVSGTEETMDRMTREDIISFHSRYYLPNNSIIAIAGDITEKEAIEIVNRYFGRWKKGKITPVLNPEPPEVSKPNVLKIHRDLTQATIIIGHTGISRDNPDYYALSVANYILGGGGFSSRLMGNIRDKLGLAYDVHSYFASTKEIGEFRIGLQTKNESANLAIEEVIKELNRIKTEPVTDEEIEIAKGYLTGSFPLRMDTNSKVASLMVQIEFFNLGLDFPDRYKDLINAVTKEDILRVVKKYIKPDRYTLIVVADQNKAQIRY
ncbi:MAG: pitrilysin family protein, partial [Nitrospirota bacterium]